MKKSLKKFASIALFMLLFISACEKQDPPFCYECETYLGNELLFTAYSCSCGMDEQGLHALQIGMEVQTRMILGDSARVICQRK